MPQPEPDPQTQASGEQKPSGETRAFRDADEDAARQARTLLRIVGLGALATIEPEFRAPMATLTSVATDVDGTPILLMSGLALHRQALDRDPRASLLLSDIGRGDPLAHPRLTLQVQAAPLKRASEDGQRARRRFLARHPKAGLYADFADFDFVRLEFTHGWLNGGFGKAWRLTRADLIRNESDASRRLLADEPMVLMHMNNDHADALQSIARMKPAVRIAGIEDDRAQQDPRWSMMSIDVDGILLWNGQDWQRHEFDAPLNSSDDIRARLVEMARRAGT